MNKKKHVLILGGSSDIAAEVIKNFLELRWDITAHYFKNDKKVCLLAKDLDVPFNRENPQPKSLTEKFFKCMPPNCRKVGSKHTRGKKKKLKRKHKKTKRKR